MHSNAVLEKNPVKLQYFNSLLGLDQQYKSKSAANSLRVLISGSTPVHYLRESNEKEGGARQDKQKRRHCVGCYHSLSQMHGRTMAKKETKRVTTECSACPGNPRFCFECFPDFHSSD